MRDGEEGLRGRFAAPLAEAAGLRFALRWPFAGAAQDVDVVGVDADGALVLGFVRERFGLAELGAALDAALAAEPLLPLAVREAAGPVQIGERPRLVLAAREIDAAAEAVIARLALRHAAAAHRRRHGWPCRASRAAQRRRPRGLVPPERPAAERDRPERERCAEREAEAEALRAREPRPRRAAPAPCGAAAAAAAAATTSRASAPRTAEPSGSERAGPSARASARASTPSRSAQTTTSRRRPRPPRSSSAQPERDAEAEGPPRSSSRCSSWATSPRAETPGAGGPRRAGGGAAAGGDDRRGPGEAGESGDEDEPPRAERTAEAPAADAEALDDDLEAQLELSPDAPELEEVAAVPAYEEEEEGRARERARPPAPRARAAPARARAARSSELPGGEGAGERGAGGEETCRRREVARRSSRTRIATRSRPPCCWRATCASSKASGSIRRPT